MGHGSNRVRGPLEVGLGTGGTFTGTVARGRAQLSPQAQPRGGLAEEGVLVRCTELAIDGCAGAQAIPPTAEGVLPPLMSKSRTRGPVSALDVNVCTRSV